MKRPILVLGAEGFIGQRVVQRLAVSGWAEPLAGVRRRATGHSMPGRQYVVNLVDATSIAEVLADATAVVNCTELPNAAMVAATQALVDAMRLTGRDIRLVHVSSMSVYGTLTGTVEESSELRGDLGPYSKARVSSEAIARTHPRTVVFRPGVDYGPGGQLWSVRIARYLQAHRLGDLGTAGDGCCNLVHVDDVAAAIVRALELPATDGAIYNLASADPPSWNEYLTEFSRALRAGPLRRISHRWLKLESAILAPPLKIAELSARAAHLPADWLPPPIPASLLRLMRQPLRLDSTRAMAELGLSWMPMREGLRDTAEWINHRRGH